MVGVTAAFAVYIVVSAINSLCPLNGVAKGITAVNFPPNRLGFVEVSAIQKVFHVIQLPSSRSVGIRLPFRVGVWYSIVVNVYINESHSFMPMVTAHNAVFGDAFVSAAIALQVAFRGSMAVSGTFCIVHLGLLAFSASFGVEFRAAHSGSRGLVEVEGSLISVLDKFAAGLNTDDRVDFVRSLEEETGTLTDGDIVDIRGIILKVLW